MSARDACGLGTGRGARRDPCHGAPGQLPSAISHFGHGVLTFHVPVISRTERGWDLMVSGPINAPKDATAPLSGVVETDGGAVQLHHELALLTRSGPARSFSLPASRSVISIRCSGAFWKR